MTSHPTINDLIRAAGGRGPVVVSAPVEQEEAIGDIGIGRRGSPGSMRRLAPIGRQLAANQAANDALRRAALLQRQFLIPNGVNLPDVLNL
jgi:hypothetical protein